ncbi:hypothetical protein BKA67DRAFT_411295 [Truncatella angustata]|uniref:Zn(2)-C6 fungal-type domain-containing protein n=1 Tax=Truncatella angustata TaxID=152316 RepID=A0A9P8RNS0_9PEZI|nr:uncharacterized protein BKA67DRAFT_411295 [Truncatella angustata]KAH6646556.1 hypothetical protein BKA67DRAFT_411295 [Truncatella angustata]
MAPHAVTSRRKSCDACVRGKRRCDQRSPACSQCIKKRVSCLYRNQPNRNTPVLNNAVMQAEDESPTSASPHQDHLESSFPDFTGGYDLNLDLDGQHIQIEPLFDSLLDTIAETSLPNGFWHNTAFTENLQDGPKHCEMVLTSKDYWKMAHICPWQLSDPNTEAAFGMGFIKNLLTQFANQSSTPFLHRHLYKTHVSPWITQVFSTCVLYTHVNSSNRGMVLRVLHENVTNLLESASGTNLVPQQKIARVHALMLYQVIRMFDGDITLGTQADADVAILMSWIDDLCTVRDNLKEESGMRDSIIRSRPPESWERWIFAESVRRTCIFGYAQIFFWNLLKCRVK